MPGGRGGAARAGQPPLEHATHLTNRTAIILVILRHSAAILLKYDIDGPDILLSFNESFLPYRMPTLMCLQGIRLPASLASPLPTYFSGKLRLVTWPFVIWNKVHVSPFQQHSTMASIQF